MLLHLLRVAHANLRAAAKRARSPRWRGMELAFLTVHPYCAACGGVRALQVHHKQPFALKPELEMDPKNLLVLCMGQPECHLRVGHGGSFRTYNPHVVYDAASYLHFPERRELVVARARKNRLPG